MRDIGNIFDNVIKTRFDQDKYDDDMIKKFGYKFSYEDSSSDEEEKPKRGRPKKSNIMKASSDIKIKDGKKTLDTEMNIMSKVTIEQMWDCLADYYSFHEDEAPKHDWWKSEKDIEKLYKKIAKKENMEREKHKIDYSSESESDEEEKPKRGRPKKSNIVKASDYKRGIAYYKAANKRLEQSTINDALRKEKQKERDIRRKEQEAELKRLDESSSDEEEKPKRGRPKKGNIMKARSDIRIKDGKKTLDTEMNIKKGLSTKEKKALKSSIDAEFDKKIKGSGLRNSRPVKIDLDSSDSD